MGNFGRHFQKKGQITVFIIMGILVVTGVVLFFTIKPFSSGKGDINTDSVRTYVLNCIEKTGKEAILSVSEGGGYVFPPENSTDSGITYYYLDRKERVPSKEILEREISSYIEDRLFFCTENFVDFPEYNITQKGVEAETSINEGSVLIDIDYPILVEKGDSKSEISKFEFSYPVRLGMLYDTVKELFGEEAFQDGICLNPCIFGKAESRDFYVDMYDFEDDNKTGTIFVFEDRNSKINDKNLKFMFANEY